MPRVLYLVHDLCDPAVRRRVAMLEAGGAAVTLAGFRRALDIPPELERLSPVDLGRTRDGRFAQRLAAVAAAALSLGSRLKGVMRPDVIIGRNLEMLVLAARARARSWPSVPVVYECLDIHRLLLGQTPASRTMRAAERRLCREASLILTSSPAFIRDYFRPIARIDTPAVLLSNKVLELSGKPQSLDEKRPLPTAGRPWIIGWFGALRCRKSLDLLAAFTRAMEGRFEVVLRGRPARSELPDFERFVAAEPFMRFEGPYRNPEDLARIYGAVHFSWAIDFFEEGLNSDWLLPNRLYEGCRYGAVPIAMRRTETGRFLAGRDMGLLLDEARPPALARVLGPLGEAEYMRLREKILAEDRATWVSDLSDCRALVERLANLPTGIGANLQLQAA
ncbi:MAG: glycosyl transferase family 1 [Rhizobiales bacterium 65-79]|jgi:succinoglycan biosynthesis protein ExoL|nr:glycosyl transferase family 1 [Hyphomicrobiales bacterium]OJU01137.1 MAG: glycosyl transferase family 1 [Rhizobiales bacterium 65-79]